MLRDFTCSRPSLYVRTVYVSTHLSRPYKTLPMKSMDFSPFTLGYLACLNAASITLVVFSFTFKNTETELIRY